MCGCARATVARAGSCSSSQGLAFLRLCLRQSPAFNGNPILEIQDLTSSIMVTSNVANVGRIPAVPRTLQLPLRTSSDVFAKLKAEVQFRLRCLTPQGTFFTNLDDAVRNVLQ
jgi:hypothetical protein